MIVETEKGKFEIIKEEREAFDKEKFEERYIEECFDKYDYIVGDVSSGLLRIKGFTEKQGKNSYKFIPDYLSESCAYNCAFYILKRVKKNG